MVTYAFGSISSFVAPMPNVSNVLTVKLEHNTHPLWLAQIVSLLRSRSLMKYVDGTSIWPPAFLFDAADSAPIVFSPSTPPLTAVSSSTPTPLAAHAAPPSPEPVSTITSTVSLESASPMQSPMVPVSSSPLQS
ncbi:PREDICTED: probable leucine-rich repeat receptor kinase At1g35710 [Prunus dulcis]|uniref:PREDICTED: probable leucine-rich repeat receptor kinase At1g35710 n=1 Tax=Prunus dulcis TaxID=3755 RepID=A0A5E4FJW6_PRUDU|nr:PREDICTED: probable leucine-rich repeat receptor kinase At1g35710 [Prunus dulcis]